MCADVAARAGDGSAFLGVAFTGAFFALPALTLFFGVVFFFVLTCPLTV